MAIEPQEAEGPSAQEDTREPDKETAPQEFVDTSFLPFPTLNRRPLWMSSLLVLLK
jgi:hypothetical protein